MSKYTYRVLSDRGEHFAVYESVIDQFVTPPSTLAECARETGDILSFSRKEASRHTFDLRSRRLSYMKMCLEILKAGRPLIFEEAKAILDLCDFLEATVAPHQYSYEEVGERVVEAWIKELGLSEQCSEYSGTIDFVSDRALYPAVHYVVNKHLGRAAIHSDPATEAQNILAGRYVEALAGIANVLGDQRSEPEDIMRRFYQQLLTRKQGE